MTPRCDIVERKQQPDHSMMTEIWALELDKPGSDVGSITAQLRGLG